MSKKHYYSEIETIKILGEKIGYGNMMGIASALWRENLKQNSCPISGAFIPVLPSDIKSGCKSLYKSENERMDEIINDKR